MNYSVIIPTYNRARQLRDALQALLRQDIPAEAFEVVVIDDGSRDHTATVFHECVAANNAKNFFYFRIGHGGPAKARNAGVRRSRGEILFFTDDDCVPPPYWIRKIAEAYRRYPDAAGVGGWHIGAAVRRDTLARYTLAHGLEFARWGDRFLREEAYGTDPASKVGTTANMSYRRTVFEELGGFDESISFQGLEDWDLKFRVCAAGKPLVYVPVFVVHRRRGNILSFAKRAFLSGRGSRYMRIRYGNRYLLPLGGDIGDALAWWRIRWGMRSGGVPFVLLSVLQAGFWGLGWRYGVYHDAKR